MRGVLALTGATGFVGSHAMRAALAEGWQVRAVARSVGPPVPGVTWVQADLRDAARVRGLFAGADAVLHCASAIDAAPEVLEAVNVRGTEAVVDEVERSAVGAFGILSTAAVYRDGLHHDAREGELAEEPGSETSRTRLVADQAVRAAGGFAVRPHLVVGPGDRWVVPAGVRALRGGLLGVEGAPVHSFVDVRDVARLLVRLLESPAARGAVVHASYPARTWPEVLRPLVGDLGASGDGRGLSARHRSLLEIEHTYDGSRARELTGWSPLHDPARPGADSVAWYRETLAHL